VESPAIGHDNKLVHSDADLTVLVPCPYPADRMRPLPDRAEGRASPKGIPISGDRTGHCIVGVGPWFGATLSIAQFLATNGPARC
jgi:hypothetical protein